MSSPRSLALLVMARALGVTLRRSGRRAGLALVYHALAERHGDPARELVPPHAAALFEGQLRHVIAHYRPVRADELVAAAAARKPGERFPVAITFDDDLASHARLAAPILSDLGVPATFFLCGASLERPSSFWWERLQRAVDLGLDVRLEGGIHEQAARIEEMGAEERARVAERLGHALGAEPENAGVQAAHLRALVAAGFDAGFHTLRHDRLPDLDDAGLARALTEGRAALEAAARKPLTTIAYPHGRADARVARAALDAGFRFGFTGRCVPVEQSSDPLLLGRVEPSFRSVEGFAVQLVRTLLQQPHR